MRKEGINRCVLERFWFTNFRNEFIGIGCGEESLLRINSNRKIGIFHWETEFSPKRSSHKLIDFLFQIINIVLYRLCNGFTSLFICIRVHQSQFRILHSIENKKEMKYWVNKQLVGIHNRTIAYYKTHSQSL